ncbi:MAG TPA: hypothetical protein PKY51_05550 [Fimbriimonadaceae bacterium]|nr:hypothetical protein [Fimbriimonadaceae bacterium]
MIPSPEPLKSNLNLRESIFPVLCAPTKTQITDAGENFIDAGAKSYAAGTNITDAGGNFIDAGAKSCVARSNIIDAGAKSYVAGSNITVAGAKSYIAGSNITNAGAKSDAAGGNITDAGSNITDAGSNFTGARTPNLWPRNRSDALAQKRFAVLALPRIRATPKAPALSDWCSAKPGLVGAWVRGPLPHRLSGRACSWRSDARRSTPWSGSVRCIPWARIG